MLRARERAGGCSYVCECARVWACKSVAVQECGCARVLVCGGKHRACAMCSEASLNGSTFLHLQRLLYRLRLLLGGERLGLSLSRLLRLRLLLLIAGTGVRLLHGLLGLRLIALNAGWLIDWSLDLDLIRRALQVSVHILKLSYRAEGLVECLYFHGRLLLRCLFGLFFVHEAGALETRV